MVVKPQNLAFFYCSYILINAKSGLKHFVKSHFVLTVTPFSDAMPTMPDQGQYYENEKLQDGFYAAQ